MNSATENIGALVPDDLIVDPVTGLPEDTDEWASDVFSSDNLTSRLWVSIAVSLAMQVETVLTVYRLFGVPK